MARRLLAIVLGSVLGLALIMTVELTNYMLFPFPPDMDTSNLEQVRSFAARMPPLALAMLFVGWFLGALIAGGVASLVTRDGGRSALGAGLVLTVVAAVNAWIVRNPLWFHVGGLLLFVPVAMLGARLVDGRRSSRLE